MARRVPEGFSRTLSRMDEEFDELMERLFRSEEGRPDPTPEWFAPRPITASSAATVNSVACSRLRPK
jgi:hypothetical protein